MGSRRIGARRLDSLLRRGVTGKDTSYRAGSDWDDCLKSHRMYNEGIFVITEIAIDLGSSAATIKAPGGNDKPFGLDGGSQAYIMQWEDDIHGKFHLAELYVVEAFSTGNAISLSSGDQVEALNDTVNNRADILAGLTTGAATSNSAHGSLDDGEYVYITEDSHSSSAALTAGQVVVRLIGIKTADISVD